MGLMGPMRNEGFIPPHGNYRELLSYQKAEVVPSLKQGGLRERMTRARLQARRRQPN